MAAADKDPSAYTDTMETPEDKSVHAEPVETAAADEDFSVEAAVPAEPVDTDIDPEPVEPEQDEPVQPAQRPARSGSGPKGRYSQVSLEDLDIFE
jgi:hypothetical protein